MRIMKYSFHFLVFPVVSPILLHLLEDKLQKFSEQITFLKK